MNILLLGYGKMGKAIEKIAIDRGNNVVQAVHAYEDVNVELSDIDVAIEFSSPGSAFENIKFAIEHGIPVVSGTTGWLNQWDMVQQLVDEHKGTFFYASNFSLGVNLFFRLNKELAQLMKKFNYQPIIEEIHHIHKLDAPSGTAITLAEGIIEHDNNLTHWVNDKSKQENELSIISKRKGEEPGTHIITYKGDHDEIQIMHKAYNRQGFALGAVQVAEWIVGKKGMLSMNDFLKT